MRVSRTRFSKRRIKRKTEFPIVALVQKKRKVESIKSLSFGIVNNQSSKEPGFSNLAGDPKEEKKSPTLSENKTLSDSYGNTKIKVTQKNRATKPPKKSRATIDYKNVILLRNLITAEGKILPRRINKLTAKQQRYVQKSIKTARIMGLIPFINKSRPF